MSVVEQERTETTIAADVLNAAADLIEEYGWCQFNYFGANGGYCAHGAIIQSWPTDDNTIPSRIYEALLPLLPSTQSLASWNDRPGRTQAEVVGLLREAASCAT